MSSERADPRSCRTSGSHWTQWNYNCVIPLRPLTTATGAAPLLEYLTGRGVIPAPTDPPAAGPCADVLERYRRYLVSERGLTGPQVPRHLATAVMFAGSAAAVSAGSASCACTPAACRPSTT
jgi:hypothetical protein